MAWTIGLVSCYIQYVTFIMLHSSCCIHHIAFSVLHSSYNFLWFHRHWHAQDRNCIWDWFHVTFITALARIFPTFLSAPTIIQLCAQPTAYCAHCPLSTITSAYFAAHNPLSSSSAHSQLHTVQAQYQFCTSNCILHIMPTFIMPCTHITAYHAMLSP